MKSKLFIPILITLLYISCNKDTLTSTDNTVREKLTGKTFKLVQLGIDANGNGFPDDNGIPGNNELKYTDSTTTFEFMLNDNGTGHITFANKDTSGEADLTWTLDATNTYINSNIPALHKSSVVSKIIDISNSSITGIVDTSANPKWLAYFTRVSN